MQIRFKAILSRFKPFYYLFRIIVHTTKDKANHWFSISYEYSSNVNYFNYKLSCYCLLISYFHSNKFCIIRLRVRVCMCAYVRTCAPVRIVCVCVPYQEKYRLHISPYFVQFLVYSLKILHK